jgi:hypothetical protein
MHKEIFVVGEGTTDFEVLKSIIVACGNATGQRYRARALWPGDRYAGKAGWSSMKKWCQEQASALRGDEQRTLAAAMINPKLANAVVRRVRSSDKIGAALAIAAAGHRRELVLQIDADIAEQLLDECAANRGMPLPLSVAHRKAVCENALASWLGGHHTKIGAGIIICVSTFAIETWILATHDQYELAAKCGVPIVIADYDHLPDPDEHLVALGYAGNSAGGVKYLRKSAGLYATYGERIASNFVAARSRSASLDFFCGKVVL